jgi:hypothetical protein
LSAYIFAGNFNFLVKNNNFEEGVFKLSVVRLVYRGYYKLINFRESFKVFFSKDMGKYAGLPDVPAFCCFMCRGVSLSRTTLNTVSSYRPLEM